MLEKVVNRIIRWVVRLFFRLEDEELSKLPPEGPGILVSNHTSNLEGPIIYVLIQPRSATGLAKRELWGNVATRFFMHVWQLIPISRGRPDPRAMQRALRALERGQFLGIAPEGTRSRTGALQRGYPGTALLATAKQVPIYPVVQWGMPEVSRRLKQLRKPRLVFRVGRPFVLPKREGKRPSLNELREMTDEIMYQLALLLPEGYRGYYSDLSQRKTDYLKFL